MENSIRRHRLRLAVSAVYFLMIAAVAAAASLPGSRQGEDSSRAEFGSVVGVQVPPPAGSLQATVRREIAK